MTSIADAFQTAIQHHTSGDLSAAEVLYRQILLIEPIHAEALFRLGLIALQRERLQDACEWFQRALDSHPVFPEVYCNLGVALGLQNRRKESIDALRTALRLRPTYAVAYNNLGKTLRDDGRNDEHLILCREWLTAIPQDAEAYSQLAVALLNHGEAEKALAAAQQAIAIKPGLASAYNTLGNVLDELAMPSEALAAYQQAVTLQPNDAIIQYNLAYALRKKGELDAAIFHYQQAISFQPNDHAAFLNLGNCFKDVGHLDKALECYRHSAELQPQARLAWSNYLYTLTFCPDKTATTIYAEHQRWFRDFVEPFTPGISPHKNERSPHRRIRIGYVSHDFRTHVVGRNILPLFREHDHSQFEIVAYSLVTQDDDLTRQFQSHADIWHSASGTTDSELEKQIREDGIDILVDLSLHMNGNRLFVFAHKPAPVQVTFAGYPGTTGLKTIDYRLTDIHLDPPNLFDSDYSEQSIRLPDSFWCYAPESNEPAVNEVPALRKGYVTFGCLNNFCKVNEEVLRLWARVLKAVPESHLLLMTPEGSVHERVNQWFHEAGIATDRLNYVTAAIHQQYLENYHHIDIGLDTFPYNGHTTNLDALWMGVPVISLVGQTVVGRAGLCQLTNLEMSEWIAYSTDQYVALAQKFAADFNSLQEIRSTLRARMENSPLMNAKRFTRNIEAAYRQMWQRYCASIS